MAIKPLKGGRWELDIYPQGRLGPRVRKKFATKGEAARFERELALNADNDLVIQPPNQNSLTKLSTLVTTWYDLHGHSLSDSKKRLSKLNNLCEHLGNPYASDVNQEMFSIYRQKRLAGEFSRKPKVGKVKIPKEATINREHSYLRAVFNELKRLGHWQGDNPLDGMRQFKEEETELAFLYADDIKRLLVECDKLAETAGTDVDIITRICLATGARWSEGETLKQSQVMPYKVTFTKTKGKKNRTVPISEALYKLIPKKRGRLFKDSYKYFEKAINNANIQLPPGQLTHVLRHTFASHFMMNGGNILVLKDILGHSSITMTMKYAHFAPDHLEAAVTLNPYDRLNS